jgi:hypothetical protein
MSFGNVDDQERNLVPVSIVKLVEGGNLPPEGGSSVAAKDHYDRLALIQFRQPNGAGFIEFG